MADNPPVMGHPHSEPPTQWSKLGFTHAGDDIYYIVIDPPEPRNVLVYHWHAPTNGDAHRWSMSSCGNHEIVLLEPLTLSPSLACENGCPSHGFLEHGRWRPV